MALPWTLSDSSIMLSIYEATVEKTTALSTYSMQQKKIKCELQENCCASTGEDVVTLIQPQPIAE